MIVRLSSTSQSPSLTTTALLPLLRRVLGSWLFIAVLLFGFAATGVLAYISRPVFRSEAVLLYQDQGGANPVGMQRETPTARRVGVTLQETLFSRALLERLIREFHLYEKNVTRYGVGAGIEEMQKKDLHFNIRDGYTFRVSFDAKSPELAQSVVKRASELLLQSHLDAQAEEEKQIQAFLASEKARAEEDVRERESALSLLLAKHPEVLEVAGGRGPAMPGDSSVGDTTSLGLEMQALQLRERIEQSSRKPQGASQAGPVRPGENGSEARTRAEMEVAAAQRELAEKQAQFTEEYPDVKRAAMRLATAKAYLRRVETSTSAPAAAPAVPSPSASPQASPSGADKDEVKFLQQQLELIEKQVRASRGRPRRSQPRTDALTDPEALAKVRSEYVELERRARETREHLALLENRHFQVEMQGLFTSQGKQGDLVIVDPAFKPVAPLRSTRNKVLIIGLLASLALAVGLSLFVTLWDDQLRGREDLLRFGLPPLLCEVPAPDPESEP